VRPGLSRRKYKMSAFVKTPPQDGGVKDAEITSWAAGGRGIARIDGRVWMIDGAIPGDRVDAEVLRDHGRFVEARAVRVTGSSPLRRVPPCPIQSECGGCPLMAADEDAQRSAKRRFVVDALSRIGKLPGVPVDPIVAAPSALAYRNKIELAFGRDALGRRILGYHRSGAAEALLDVAACEVADSRIAPLLSVTRSFFLEGEGKGDPALDLEGEPVRVVLRVSGAREQALIGLRGPGGSIPSASAFAGRAMATVPGLSGVVRIHSRPKARGGAAVETLAGRPFIDDVVLGIGFLVPAATFLQIHAGAAEALWRHVVDGAVSPGRAVELYAGVGAVGLALARGGASVACVEADPDAVACCRGAAETNAISGVRAIRADVLRFLDGPPASARRPDLLVADPPRTGLGRGVAGGIARLAPKRIAMVSCDPATLARDLATLVREGYAVDRVVPFDLFPQTAHVEAVAWLSR
jgi:23S rRNA (uracil1939-C5)-methyltransferase